MPFVLLVTLAVFCLARVAAQRSWPRDRRACLDADRRLAIGLPAGRSPASGVGFGQLALDALPSACWGLALAIAYQSRWLVLAQGIAKTLACLAVAIGLTLGLLCDLGRNRLVENLSGVALLGFTLGDWTSPRLEGIARLGPWPTAFIFRTCSSSRRWKRCNRNSMCPSRSAALGIFVLAAAGSTLSAWTWAAGV